MESFFCYTHNKMAFRVGNDYYDIPVFLCPENHYLLANGEERPLNRLDVKPRQPKTLDEQVEEFIELKKLAKESGKHY